MEMKNIEGRDELQVDTESGKEIGMAASVEKAPAGLPVRAWTEPPLHASLSCPLFYGRVAAMEVWWHMVDLIKIYSSG